MAGEAESPQTDKVPPVRTRTMRVDDETWNAAKECAKAQGVTVAEYARRALVAQLAEDRETAAMQEGADPEQFKQAMLARMLSRAATDVQMVARALGNPPD